MSASLVNEIRCWSSHKQCKALIFSIRTFQTSTRTASTQKQADNPFPYPTHRNPTPHQLFHLPRNATESDIKARYFDLVRLYHPDKVGASASSDLAHARFQAITAAYDILRGKSSLAHDVSKQDASSFAPRYQSTAAFRAMRKKRQELYDSGPIDDGRKDNLILFGVAMTILLVMVQLASVRREVLLENMSRHMEPARQSHRTQEENKLSQDSIKTMETS